MSNQQVQLLTAKIAKLEKERAIPNSELKIEIAFDKVRSVRLCMNQTHDFDVTGAFD